MLEPRRGTGAAGRLPRSDVRLRGLGAIITTIVVVGLLGSCGAATAVGARDVCDADGVCSSSPVGGLRTSAPPAARAGWRRVIDQGFDRNAALGRFRSVYPGWAQYDGSTDTSRNTGRAAASRGLWTSATTTSVHDGVYDCFVHTSGVRPQVCALTPTPTRRWWAGQRYGRFSVRFHIDAVPGYKIAWLLWPSTGRWSDGEIDFPEGDLDGTATATAHRIGDPASNAYIQETGRRLRGWHTATISWTPGLLRFTMDGRSWRTTAADGLPSTRMHWALQAETSFSDAPPPAGASGHILIDWVTVDALKG